MDGDGAVSFEARLSSFVAGGRDGVRWSAHNQSPPIFKRAIELFQDRSTVREVAAALHISKTEAGRMRLRATEEGLLEPRNGTERAVTNGHVAISMEA